ncbi:MAG TPA: SRPBCC family protein [Nocardioidaceae bacterium]|nr:SRPBCC family protein [Nocardioidaceae bacterium]
MMVKEHERFLEELLARFSSAPTGPELTHLGELAHAIWIQADPEAVWRTYVDPHRVPDWQTGRPVIEDVHGGPGSTGSTYVSRRGRLAARTTVLASEAPARLVTRTEAYFGLELVITSRLTQRAGGTDLALTVETHWSAHGRLVHGIVERAVLNDREARKELANLKLLIEREGGTTQGHPPIES